MQYGYATNKPAVTNRLHRIEGQVRGIEKMVQNDTYCIDILTQIGAVKSALDTVAMELLKDHVEHCMNPSMELPNGSKNRSEELISTIKRLR